MYQQLGDAAFTPEYWKGIRVPQKYRSFYPEIIYADIRDHTPRPCY